MWIATPTWIIMPMRGKQARRTTNRVKKTQSMWEKHNVKRKKNIIVNKNEA